MKKLTHQQLETLRYVFWGSLTGLVNLATYFLCNLAGNIPYLTSNLLAWVVTVIFAYTTEKWFVFHTKAESPAALCREFLRFASSRVFSGVVDQLLLFLLVRCVGLNSSLVKLLNSGIVVLLNYLVAKRFVFRRQSKRKGEAK